MDLKSRWNELYRSIKYADIKDLILNKEYSKALDSCRTPDDGKRVCEIFILDIINPSNNQAWKKLDYSKMEESIPLLTNIFYQIGLRETYNPFIKFIQIYKDRTGKEPTKKTIIIVNNAYADDYISYEDMIGKGMDKSSHLIFNPNLYELSGRDAEFMLSSYNWLSKEKNLSSMNLKAFNTKELPSNIREIATYEITGNIDQDKKHIRNVIIYDNPKNVSNSPLNAQYTVEKALRISTLSKENEESSNNTTKNSYEDTDIYKDTFNALENVGFKAKAIYSVLDKLDFSKYENAAESTIAALKYLKRI